MQRIVQQSLMKRIGGAAAERRRLHLGRRRGDLPYDIPNIRVEYTETDPGIPFGFWRSVGASVQGFVVEAFIDELATAAGKDPYRVPARPARQASAPPRGARARRREGGLGQAAAGRAARAASRVHGVLRQHRRPGRGGVGRRNGAVRVHKIVVRGRLAAG